MVMDNKKKILVTGGAGFIGSHLCKRLISMGQPVVCIDNLNTYYNPLRKIENIRPLVGNPLFDFHVVDIVDYDHLEDIFKAGNIGCVVHLAARAGVRPSIEQPLRYRDTNVTGTVNLLALAAQYGVENFVFGSSSSIYGKNHKVPFSEDDHVDQPVSPYAATKKACELFCYTYSHLTPLNITCLRYFTVYGPSGRPDMAPYLFTDRIYKGQEITVYGPGMERDFTYIDDIVDGTIAALNKQLKFEIVNLGSSHPIDLDYFISVIEGLLGKRANINRKAPLPGDVMCTYADVSKAWKLFDYQPKVSIGKGMENFTRWYFDNVVKK
jgi:UDP-glucuronate 4-epimerase